jgi:hypothetical protein
MDFFGWSPELEAQLLNVYKIDHVKYGIPTYTYYKYYSLVALWPSGQSARRANVEAKQRS